MCCLCVCVWVWVWVWVYVCVWVCKEKMRFWSHFRRHIEEQELSLSPFPHFATALSMFSSCGSCFRSTEGVYLCGCGCGQLGVWVCAYDVFVCATFPATVAFDKCYLWSMKGFTVCEWCRCVCLRASTATIIDTCTARL